MGQARELYCQYLRSFHLQSLLQFRYDSGWYFHVREFLPHWLLPSSLCIGNFTPRFLCTVTPLPPSQIYTTLITVSIGVLYSLPSLQRISGINWIGKNNKLSEVRFGHWCTRSGQVMWVETHTHFGCETFWTFTKILSQLCPSPPNPTLFTGER